MTTRKWAQPEPGYYTFYDGDEYVGYLRFHFDTVDTRAEVEINGAPYTIRRAGFWKNKLEVVTPAGNILAHTYYEKWYANTSVLEYNGRKYRLVVRNNPLAEIAIQENAEDKLAYGLLADEGRIKTVITTSGEANNWMFDFILWYQFAPIAQENMGDMFDFV